MTNPAEQRTRGGGFQHDITRLHALWRREGANALAMAPPGLAVAEVADGLACLSEGQEIGRVTLRDGAMIASPPFAVGTSFPDCITRTELAVRLISAAGRLRKGGDPAGDGDP